MVTWDHGQTQNSGFSLGECVCNHRTIKLVIHFLIYDLILLSYSILKVQNDYCQNYVYMYTGVPFIFYELRREKQLFIQPVDLRNSCADPRMTLQSRSVQRNSPTRVRPSVIRILMFLFRSPSSFCLAWNDEDMTGCSCMWTES